MEEAAFRRYSRRAKGYVASVATDDGSGAFSEAVCAVAEAMAQQVKKESAGDFSVEYADNGQSLYGLVKLYVGPEAVLYRGR